MSAANFIPEVWSARVLYSLRKNYVFRGLVNTDYQGEITSHGDTVHINTPSAITVEDDSGDITYEDITSTQQDLLIDQKKRFAFKVKDVDQVQSNIQLVNSYTQEAGFALGDTVDQAIAAKYTAVGETVALDVSSNSDGVYLSLTECNRKLSENNVRYAGRWMIVSPLVHAKMRLSDDFIKASDMGDNIMRSGQVGMMEGFNIFESNNIVVATQHKCMFGTSQAITFAEQLVEVEGFRLHTEFSDAVRGLMVYGMKVIRPGALGLLNVTVA